MTTKKDEAQVFIDLAKQDLFICKESDNKTCLKYIETKIKQL